MSLLIDGLSPDERSKLISLRRRLKAEGKWEVEIKGEHPISDILSPIEVYLVKTEGYHAGEEEDVASSYRPCCYCNSHNHAGTLCRKKS